MADTDRPPSGGQGFQQDLGYRLRVEQGLKVLQETAAAATFSRFLTMRQAAGIRMYPSPQVYPPGISISPPSPVPPYSDCSPASPQPPALSPRVSDDAEAAALRAAWDREPIIQACKRCGTRFNRVREDGTVERLVGPRRKYCLRNEDGTITGRLECVQKRDAERQAASRARRKQRQLEAERAQCIKRERILRGIHTGPPPEPITPARGGYRYPATARADNAS
jgi:hypothetical protein